MKKAFYLANFLYLASIAFAFIFLVVTILAYKIDVYVFDLKEFSDIGKQILIENNLLVKMYYTVSLINLAYLFFFASVLIFVAVFQERIDRFLKNSKYLVYSIRAILAIFAAFFLMRYFLSIFIPAGTFLTASAVFYLPLLLSSVMIIFLAFKIRLEKK